MRVLPIAVLVACAGSTGAPAPPHNTKSAPTLADACDGGDGPRCTPPRAAGHTVGDLAQVLRVAHEQCRNRDADACSVAKDMSGPPCAKR